MLRVNESGAGRFDRMSRFLRALGREVRDDDVMGLASQVAFNMVFAIPPFVIFLFTVVAIVNKVVGLPIATNLEQFINLNIPGDARALMIDIVDETVARVDAQTISVGATLSLILALWGAGRGVGSLITALNRAYDITDRRPFLRQHLLRISLTLLVTNLIVASFLLFLFGQRIGDWLAGRVGFGSKFDLIWSLLRWPAAVLLMLFLLDILYAYGPCMEHRFRLFSAGSLLVTGLWVVSIFGFKLYLALSDPGTAYGAAGSVVVLLLFLYVTSIFFILGAEVNSLLTHSRSVRTRVRVTPAPGAEPKPAAPVKTSSRGVAGRAVYAAVAVVTAAGGVLVAMARRRSQA